jgi:hypothetical protein
MRPSVSVNRCWCATTPIRLWACLLALLLVLALPLAWLTSAPAPRPKAAKGLYSDELVRVVARHDIARLRPGEHSPDLSVVPEGEMRSLGEVLKALGFEVTRLQEPLVHMFRFTITLSWRVSPSYHLHCGIEPENPHDLFDLTNRVYSVWICKRSAVEDKITQAR